jgi:hypothetical protein
MLFEGGGPDWFFLLSAADYPVADGNSVRRQLAETTCDAFIDARSLRPGEQGAAKLIGNPNPRLAHFATPENVAMKRRFYLSTEVWLPLLRFRPRIRIGRYTYRSGWEGRHPFRNGLLCFYGDHWFTGNRRAAAALLAKSPWMQALKRHYRFRTHVDESFHATVLANTPGLTLCLDNKRFAEWHGGGAHPIVLEAAHAQEALASGAFFARKVNATNGFAAAIDKALDAKPGAGAL